MSDPSDHPLRKLIAEIPRSGLRQVLGIAVAILCYGCEGGDSPGSPSGPEPDPEPQNAAPAANAGPDQVVPVGLDGSGSSDPDGDSFTYQWSLASVPSGSTAALEDLGSARTGFVPDLPGTYVVQLVVNDGMDNSAPDQATITAVDNSAAATIGPAGGEIQSKDGALNLSIPAGALAADTEIRVTLELASEGGPGYDLAPSGLEFAVPVTATLGIDEADFPDFVDENGDPLDPGENLPVVLFFLINDDGSIDLLLGSDVRRDEDSGNIIATTEIPHFSVLARAMDWAGDVLFPPLGVHFLGPSFKKIARLFLTTVFQSTRYVTSGRTLQIDAGATDLLVTGIDFDVPSPVKLESPNPNPSRPQ